MGIDELPRDANAIPRLTFEGFPGCDLGVLFAGAVLARLRRDRGHPAYPRTGLGEGRRHRTPASLEPAPVAAGRDRDVQLATNLREGDVGHAVALGQPDHGLGPDLRVELLAVYLVATAIAVVRHRVLLRAKIRRSVNSRTIQE